MAERPDRTQRPRRVAASQPQAAAATGARAAPGRPDRVRVVLMLDREALEDLELLRRYRHGPQSRSEVVREAVMWLRAKEAGWLLGARRQQERRAREAVELEALRQTSREERERLAGEDAVSRALVTVRAEQ